MAMEPPGRFSRLAMAIVVAAIIIGAGIYASSFGVTTHTVTETETSTVTTAMTTASSSTTVQSATNNTIQSCSTSPDGVGTYLYVVSDSGQPLSGVSVLASPVLNGTCYGQTGLETLLTDLDGFVSIGTLEGGAYFAISVARFGYTYNFTISEDSLDVSNATLSVPSGSLRTAICYGTDCTVSNSSVAIAQVVTTSQSSARTGASTQIITTTVTSIVTSPAECPSDATCASFAYSPTGQAQVLSVEATQFTCQNCGAVNGQYYLSFEVVLDNVGNSSIYLAGGSGELSVSVPTNSSVVHAVPTEVCPGTFTIIELGQGENYTLYGPGCDYGEDYQVVQAGTVSMTFTFDWTTNTTATSFPDSTTISAQFTFT